MGDMDTIIGIVVVGVIILVYFFIQKKEEQHEEKTTDTYVKKTMADIEKERLALQKEEVGLKRDVVDFQKQKLLSGDKTVSLNRKDNTINAEYTVRPSELEDKSKEDEQ